jgi:hypothetical protein
LREERRKKKEEKKEEKKFISVGQVLEHNVTANPINKKSPPPPKKQAGRTQQLAQKKPTRCSEINAFSNTKPNTSPPETGSPTDNP